MSQSRIRLFYSDLVEDFFFLSSLRYCLAFVLVVSNVSNFTRTHDPLSLTINIPTVLVLLVYPFLRRRGLIPPGYGTLGCFLFMLLLSLQWSFSFWVFVKNDVELLGPTVLTIVFAVLWLFALGPNYFVNALKGAFGSALFIGILHQIQPQYIEGIKGSLILGILLGIGLNAVLYQLLLYRFVITRKNQQLTEQAAKIESLFAAVPVGMLTLDGSMRLSREISPKLRIILGDLAQSGTDYLDVLRHSQLTPGEVERTRGALEAMLREDEVSFMMNEMHLAKRLVLQNRLINVGYAPLLDPQGRIHEVLVTLDDVTDLEKQQRADAVATLEGLTLASILRVPPDQFRLFMDSFRQTLETILVPEQALRNLHTLKGNARSLKLKELAHLIHELETLHESGTTLTESSAYETLRLLFGSLTSLSQLQRGDRNQGLSDFLSQSMHAASQETARILGVDAARIVVDVGSEVPDSRMLRAVLFEILPHLIGNALDHGAAPSIHCAISADAGTVCVRFWDQGRGLDLSRISKPQDLFLGGSTRTKLSEVSGRGVGLSAVAASIERRQGRYDIKLGVPQNGFCPFVFEFILPRVNL